jgi:hypothetical protein
MPNNPNTEIQIIGIDPAPGKGSCVATKTGVAPHLSNLNPSELYSYLKGVKANEQKVLVVWDAPLTAPSFQAAPEDISPKGIFTQRKIEKLFNGKTPAPDENENVTYNQDTGKYTTPAGVNTQGFGSVSHWPLSQYFWGHPAVRFPVTGDYIPSTLIASNEDVASFMKAKSGLFLIETHPALFMALMNLSAVGRPGEKLDFRYKGSKIAQMERLKRIAQLWESLCFQESVIPLLPQNEKGIFHPSNDDELDASVAYIAGSLLVSSLSSSDAPAVCILGNQATGSMLLPVGDGNLSVNLNQL